MTTRDLAYELARQAIRDASGKPMSEAVKIIAEAILGTHGPKEEAFIVEGPKEQPEPITPLFSPSEIRSKPITELAPIKPVIAPPRSVVRVRHTSETMQEAVIENTPASLDITPEGLTEQITLYRTLMVDSGNPPSVQVAYRIKDHDPEAPYVRYFLWATDDKAWDFPAIMAKLKADAQSMYRKRTKPIMTHVQQMGPVESRLAKKESV